MDKAEYIKSLKSFLVENKAFESFCRNLSNVYEQDFEMYARYLLSDSRLPHKYIKVAFIWSKTIEGWEYWYNMDLKWRSQLNNQKKRGLKNETL